MAYAELFRKALLNGTFRGGDVTFSAPEVHHKRRFYWSWSRCFIRRRKAHFMQRQARFVQQQDAALDATPPCPVCDTADVLDERRRKAVEDFTAKFSACAAHA